MSEHDRNVSALPRVLKFHPVRTVPPKTLTADDIDFYNRNGYLAGLSVFTEEQIALRRRQFDAILERFLARGMDSYAIDRYHDRIGEIYDVAMHPKILDIVEDMVGPDIICWATHYFCKMPGDLKQVAWHQDCSY